MAQDLFEDSTMTFGEHLEELRAHLWRAIQGVLVVLLVMLFCGQYVVKIITRPLEQQLKIYKDERRHRYIEEIIERQQYLPDAEKLQVQLKGKLSPDSVRELSKAIGAEETKIPADGLSVSIDADATYLIQNLAIPMAEALGMDHLRTFSVQEGFMMYFKAALGASIVIASPWVFYQLYSFVAVGLYAHERRFVNLSLPFSVALFLAGVFLCYFVMMPFMLQFFLGANSWMDLEPDIRLSEWVGFAVMITLLFGVMFQLPLLMLTLERVGIVTHEMLAGKRKIAIFVNFIIAAIVTPADPTTQIALAVPMCLLFELGLLLMRYFKQSNPFAVPDPVAEEQFF